MRNFIIAKDAWLYVIVLGIVSIGMYYLYAPISILGVLLLLFVMFFFRNPSRKIPEGDNLVISPADGTVMSVEKIDEPNFMEGEAQRVSIFLSVFNVHINRAPIEGTIKYINYRHGKFIPAFKSHASEINERNSVGIQGKQIKVLVHQITGFIARRIVCWVKEGDNVVKGQRFGLIKFGSCTEIIVPLNVDVQVKPGDKVRGGKTIIGVIN